MDAFNVIIGFLSVVFGSVGVYGVWLAIKSRHESRVSESKFVEWFERINAAVELPSNESELFEESETKASGAKLRQQPVEEELIQYQLYHLRQSAIEAEADNDMKRLDKICSEWRSLDQYDDEVYRFSTVANFYDKETLKHINQALAINPNYAEMYFLRAKFGLVHQVSTGSAIIPDLDRAIKLDPQEPEFRYLRGVVFDANGNLEGAKQDFDVFVAANPRHSRVRRLRANVLRKLGDNVAASLDERCANILDSSYRRKGFFIGPPVIGLAAIILASAFWFKAYALTSGLLFLFGLITFLYGASLLAWGISSSRMGQSIIHSEDYSEYGFEEPPRFIKWIMPPAWLLEGSDAYIEAGEKENSYSD